MERSYDERIVLYFYKKNITSALLLLILGFGIVSVGINRKDSYIFLIIGIIFAAMAVWMWIRQRFMQVKGAEVDGSADRFVENSALITKALKELDLDEEDVRDLEQLTLQGYSPMAIATEPLFRVDSEDGKARSSNYQIAYFILDEEVMFTYTQAKSLVDSEYFDGGHIWRYKAITGSQIKEIPKLCMTAPEKEEGKIEKTFNVLVISGENGETFGFAFGEDDRNNAEYIMDHINKRAKKESRMRKPNSAKPRPKETLSDLTKKDKRSYEIGIIGEEIK